MGVVYEGEDPYIGRKVAIKTIRFDTITAAAEQSELQQRFMREARSAGNLSHPSIVTIYEVGEDQGLTYIAMEYIDGESLESIIARRERPSLDVLVELISQVADALDYAHRRGIVHRDIKPANILVDREGRPRIVDFGIARVASSSLTQTSTVLGTPAYMAPEQIAGAQVDHRVDLFALGAILYEMLTFTRAFPGENVTTVIYRIMNDMPPPPRVFDASLPAGVDVVTAVALAKDPAQRYQNGKDLATDLRARVHGGPPPAEAAALQTSATVAMRVPVRTAAPNETTADFSGLSASISGPAPRTSGAVLVPPVPSSMGHAQAEVPETVQEPAPASSRRTALLAVVAAMMLVVAVAATVVVLNWKSAPTSPEMGGSGGSGAAVPAAPAPQDAPPTDPGAQVPDTGATVPNRPNVPAPPGPGAKAKARPSPPATGGAASPGRQAASPASVSPESRPIGPSSSPVARETSTPVPTGRVYDVTDVDERPQVVRQVAPTYPAEALANRLEDVVVLKALVAEDGRVADVQLLRRSQKSPALETAAIAAVRQWVFTPARKKGTPVACWFNVGVPFQLPR